jgi:tetratricopeptide (TPR) repeat protein
MLSVDRRAAEAKDSDAQRLREEIYSLNKVGDTRLDIDDISGALADYQEGLAVARKLLEADPNDQQARLNVAYSLEKVGDANTSGGDIIGALVAYEEELAIRKAFAEQAKGDDAAKIDLIRTFYKFAQVAVGAKKEAAIDQGLSLLADLDSAGALTEEQKGWKDSLLSLRNGSSQ